MEHLRLRTWKGSMTEEEAISKQFNVLPSLAGVSHTDDFKNELQTRHPELIQVIARHLGIPQSEFMLCYPDTWRRGSFNLCVPFGIRESQRWNLPPLALIRFPLPFSVGEAFSPGSVDEKLRCEAAAYIWLQRNCPSIPIPRLLGMGFPGGQSFTAIENETLWNKIRWYLRRFTSWFLGRHISPYFGHQRQLIPDLGYLIMEYIDNGKMLSTSWNTHRHDEKRRSNLFHGLSKIMVDLANIPLPRIGSWTIDDRGVISLTNRPISSLTMLWNRVSIPTPTHISRGMTYTTSESFVYDLLEHQDNRLIHQPNSIYSKNDGIHQISALVGLRRMIPKLWNVKPGEESFVFDFGDLHQSNIFVDDNWNIRCLIDFEFAASRPLRMAHVPEWLNNCSIDELCGDAQNEYKLMHDDFIRSLEANEAASKYDNTYSQTMHDNWNTGRLWHILAMKNVNGFPFVFDYHFQSKLVENFDLETDGLEMAKEWAEDIETWSEQKALDAKQYEQQIRDIFADAQAAIDDIMAQEDKLEAPVRK